MVKRICFLAATCTALFFSGCGSIVRSAFNADATPGKEVFVLEARDCARVASANDAKLPGILVAEASTDPLYATTKIVYSDEPSTRGTYQFSFWSEAPSSRLVNLLVEELRCSGRFKSVARQGSVVYSSLVLSPELQSFYYDAHELPGEVIVALRLTIADQDSGKVIAERRFEERERVQKVEAKGAVEALQRALDRLLAQVPEWAAQAVAEWVMHRS